MKQHRRRSVVSVVIYLAALAAFMAVAIVRQKAGDVPENARTATYIVQPGQTLWSIVTEVDPEADPRSAVDWVQAHNAIGQTLQVGQTLIVPVGWS